MGDLACGFEVVEVGEEGKWRPGNRKAGERIKKRAACVVTAHRHLCEQPGWRVAEAYSPESAVVGRADERLARSRRELAGGPGEHAGIELRCVHGDENCGAVHIGEGTIETFSERARALRDDLEARRKPVALIAVEHHDTARSRYIENGSQRVIE